MSNEANNGKKSVGQKEIATYAVKAGLAQMLKGGVIMDVVTPEQARIAEEAGACAVMALERVPADIRKDGGVARMSDPDMIKGIIAAVTIPVMAKARIGHFVEAQILEALGVDYIDESEVLTPADEEHHINKHKFGVPFVCGCRNLGEALRRIAEGAAMIRTKGEAGHRQRGRGRAPRPGRQRGHPPTAHHGRGRTLRLRQGDPGPLCPGQADRGVGPTARGQLRRRRRGHPGRRRPDDAARRGRRLRRLRHLQERQPGQARAKAIVQAVTHYNDPNILAEISANLGEAMVGINIDTLSEGERLASRGW